MKKISLIFTLAMAAFHFASAQSAQSVYFEIGGPGIASFNYDTRFSGKEGGIGGRIGVGGLSIDGEGVVFLPVGINYLLGKDSRHYFEIGGGVTPVFGTSDGDGTFSELFGHLVFGYRLQPLNGGFTFRAFMCPIFGNGDFIPYYAGLSFGYKF
ncbi:MAG: hypothetical protein KBA14_04480 [Saprospiraceae bacterium]|nr:hypothetical protein [Saprospiraceae bacterium]